MNIGGVITANGVFLAPMAGVTDLVFREICAGHGAGLVCGEMVSAKAMTMKNSETFKLLETSPKQGVSAIQLFGHDPAVMAEAAAMLNETAFDVVDINMGCPVAKVVKNGEGAALMTDPALAGRIVRAVAGASDKPVTVKIRKGFAGSRNAAQMAKLAEENGAAAVAVHGRTREQFYAGEADWAVIREVKGAVAIPVIGNGDVTSPETAQRMMSETGCDAVMIGRAARGNPWIFARAARFLAAGELLPEPTVCERIYQAIAHAERLTAQKGEYAAVREMRSHAGAYIKGIPGASGARAAFTAAAELARLREILLRLAG